MPALLLILDFVLIIGVAVFLLIKIWELYFYYASVPLKCEVLHIAAKPTYTTDDNVVMHEYKLKVRYTSGARTYEVLRKLTMKNKLEKEPGQEMDIYIHRRFSRICSLNKGHAGDIGIGIVFLLALLIGLLLVVLYGPVNGTISSGQ